MKSISYVLVMALLSTFAASAAKADIMIIDQKTGQDSGLYIKVVKEGDQVSYQFFQGGVHVKELGKAVSYPVSQVIAYSESLPVRVKTDGRTKMLVRVGVAVLGAGIGYMLATHGKAKSAEVAVEESGMFKRLFESYKPYFFATAGAAKFSIFGGYISDFFFVSAEEHEVRAALTSEALMENAKVVFLSAAPAKTVHELDLALKEL